MLGCDTSTCRKITRTRSPRTRRLCRTSLLSAWRTAAQHCIILRTQCLRISAPCPPIRSCLTRRKYASAAGRFLEAADLVHLEIWRVKLKSPCRPSARVPHEASVRLKLSLVSLARRGSRLYRYLHLSTKVTQMYQTDAVPYEPSHSTW